MVFSVGSTILAHRIIVTFFAMPITNILKKYFNPGSANQKDLTKPIPLSSLTADSMHPSAVKYINSVELWRKSISPASSNTTLSEANKPPVITNK